MRRIGYMRKGKHEQERLPRKRIGYMRRVEPSGGKGKGGR